MNRLSLSTKLYFALVIVLSILSALAVFLPQGDFLPTDQALPASKPLMALVNAAVALIVYGGLGYIGLILSRKLGFADVWDEAVTNRQRFVIPALAGIGLGIFFIAADAFLGRYHSLGALPHPPFPTSIVASVTAAIGEEIIFRLFFIPFWVWLISYLLLKNRRQTPVFWVVAVFSALAFAFGHLPAAMLILGIEQVSSIPPVLLAEIILLNGALSLFAAQYLRVYGFLAAVGVHFWVDIVWHVVWGAL